MLVFCAMFNNFFDKVIKFGGKIWRKGGQFVISKRKQNSNPDVVFNFKNIEIFKQPPTTIFLTKSLSSEVNFKMS